jgi:hypothetical protein
MRAWMISDTACDKEGYWQASQGTLCTSAETVGCHNETLSGLRRPTSIDQQQLLLQDIKSRISQVVHIQHGFDSRPAGAH